MEFVRDLILGPWNLVVFISVLTLLVAAHELGHYLVARWMKMEVEEFAIGFGRPRWVFRRATHRIERENAIDGESPYDEHETEYSLRAWPLGGFVRIRGMEPQEDGGEVGVRNGFYSRTPLQRIAVLFAGPLFSVLAGWALLVPLWSTVGKLGFLPEPVIGGIAKDGPADKAGLKLGDKILSAGGERVETFFDFTKHVRVRPEQNVVVEYERDGQTYTTTVTPSKDQSATAVLNEQFEPTRQSAVQGKIGALPKQGPIKLSFTQATQEAFLMPIKTVSVLVGIVQNLRRAEREVGGPITMFAATAGALEMGIPRVLELAGLLSISLGIFNLLPIPPFDGGQIVVAIAEMTRRGRRLSFKVQERIATTGLLIMLTIFIAVFTIDFRRFFTGSPEPKKSETSRQAPPK